MKAILTVSCVLILVLMEYAPRLIPLDEVAISDYGLNPCSNGICAKTATQSATKK